MVMSADASEVRAFAVELQTVPDNVVRKIPGVVKKGANNIKQTMVADFGRSRSFHQIGRAVSYDISMDATGVEAEIGPVKGSPGSLANIAYFGGANGGGGTIRDPERALEEEVPRFESALSDLLGDVL